MDAGPSRPRIAGAPPIYTALPHDQDHSASTKKDVDGIELDEGFVRTSRLNVLDANEIQEEEVGDGERVEEHRGHRHATLAQRKALWWKNVFVTGMFVLSWYTFATLLSLYNKWMFSPQYYGFGYPLFVTACHMVVQFALAGLIRLAWPRQFRPVERPTRKEYVTKVFPAAASTGGDIGLSNLSLKTITLSLYTMCKSSTLIFVLLVAFAFRLEAYSLRLMSVITLISFGVFCMVFNTTSVSITGIMMVFSASALAGVRWGLTELLMHKKAMGLSNPFATIFWLAPLMALTLGLVSMIIEGWFEILSSDFFQGFAAIRTMGVIILPGAIAFAMVASEYFIIQRAGIVPMSIAGIFKEVSTISISAWVFGDQLTELNIIGVIITVCGIALYSWHKYQKSVHSTVELDAQGRPIDLSSDDTSPLMNAAPHMYASAPIRGSTDEESAPMTSIAGTGGATQHSYPPDRVGITAEELEEDRITRLRDDFEGWQDDRADEWSDDEPDDEEVERRMKDRQIGNGNGNGAKDKKWGDWWEKPM